MNRPRVTVVYGVNAAREVKLMGPTSQVKQARKQTKRRAKSERTVVGPPGPLAPLPRLDMFVD